jgi:hypothetical protein
MLRAIMPVVNFKQHKVAAFLGGTLTTIKKRKAEKQEGGIRRR